MNEKTIRVTCDTKLRIPLDELHGIQGAMKEMTLERYEKFRKLIVKDGINFALHVWKEITPILEVTKVDKKKKSVSVKQDKPAIRWWIIDGHGRKALLLKMRDQDGFDVPELPCVEIEALSYKDAKRKVLAASSTFHRATNQGLYEFMSDLELDPAELDGYDLPDIDLPEFKAEFYEDASGAEAGSESDQGKLDEKADEKQVITCPKCMAEFTR